MFYNTRKNTPIARSDAIRLAEYYDKTRLAYSPLFHRFPTRSNLSPHILERIFREGIEYNVFRSASIKGPAYGPQMDELWQIEPWAASALADACLQVRYVVADYCGKMEYLHNSFGPFSLIYTRFMEAGIKYPPEPHCIFNQGDYVNLYGSFEDMIHQVHKAQLWGMWMIISLHCLALYDGKTPAECLRDLPNFPNQQICAAKEALKALEEGEHAWQDHYGALNHGQSAPPTPTPSPVSSPGLSAPCTDDHLYGVSNPPTPCLPSDTSDEIYQFKAEPEPVAFSLNYPSSPSSSSSPAYSPESSWTPVFDEDGDVVGIKQEEDEEYSRRLLLSPARSYISV